MTGTQAVVAAVARLRAAGITDPARDARRLLAYALEIPSDRVTLCLPEAMSDLAQTRFEAAISARCLHQPVAQITGKRAFYGRIFKVTRDVLDPRPETETLIAAALETPATRILDLGTGSGCILLTLLSEFPNAVGIGTDLSEAALTVAAANAERLGVADRADFQQADWTDGLCGPFDLIVSNPPYIAADEMPGLSVDVRQWEPSMALSPGGDGLAPYRRILPDAMGLLVDGGRVLVEIGPTQGPQVAQIAKDSGLVNVRILPDLDGRDRVVTAQRGGLVST
ncbi:peptide chain release factor N(5)-glutamine methyltransferase [Pseudoruegeria sp. SK021]|uniref:peptide chain release factor N(5)-glutamine methyltransferase n=1 Tax=Pseudoruegeria sp. SK021 TaxID=1933035 RepID=UPI000A25EC15|nr:peptide chain release factor N(5)-glutamine methyltransferase [Pseudoruegeria sp. SK021]OSP55425.1 protein-(glutamine-N5) methyltransferase, release factor-specific [Pseudoruegeria sp. SK021]